MTGALPPDTADLVNGSSDRQLSGRNIVDRKSLRIRTSRPLQAFAFLLIGVNNALLRRPAGSGPDWTDQLGTPTFPAQQFQVTSEQMMITAIAPVFGSPPSQLERRPRERRAPADPEMPNKKAKQQQLNQDYADFLTEHETAKEQGIALGTFLEWQHKNDRNGIKILDRKK